MNALTPHLAALRDGILAMPMAQTLALSIDAMEPGRVEMSMPVQDGWCFRPGQLQAAALFAIGDFALAVSSLEQYLALEPNGSKAAEVKASLPTLKGMVKK